MHHHYQILSIPIIYIILNLKSAQTRIIKSIPEKNIWDYFVNDMAKHQLTNISHKISYATNLETTDKRLIETNFLDR